MAAIPITEQIKIGGKTFTINQLTRAELDDYLANGIDAVTRKIVKRLKTFDLDAATLPQLSIALGVLIDKSRLIRGASTQNIAISGRVEAIHRIQVLGGRLEQALHGRDSQSTLSVVGDNGNCRSIPALISGNQPAGTQVLDCEAVVLDCATAAPGPVKRGRGRPPKVRLPPTPPPGPTSGVENV